MPDPNIVTLVGLEALFVGVVDKRQRSYHVVELKPDTVVGLHKSFLVDAVLVFATEKMKLVADLTAAYPDYICTE